MKLGQLLTETGHTGPTPKIENVIHIEIEVYT